MQFRHISAKIQPKKSETHFDWGGVPCPPSLDMPLFIAKQRCESFSENIAKIFAWKFFYRSRKTGTKQKIFHLKWCQWPCLLPTENPSENSYVNFVVSQKYKSKFV